MTDMYPALLEQYLSGDVAYCIHFVSRSLWITYIMADVCIHAPENNIDSCQLVLEEVHYRTFLVFQQYGLILVNFMYSRIF